MIRGVVVNDFDLFDSETLEERLVGKDVVDPGVEAAGLDLVRVACHLPSVFKSQRFDLNKNFMHCTARIFFFFTFVVKSVWGNSQ